MNPRLVLFTAVMLTTSVQAETQADILAQLVRESGQAGSPAKGEQLYRQRFAQGGAESCISCHTEDPRKPGQHVRTHKPIEPLAPVAAPKRFTDRAKVEKWFRRNCKEVMGRECTAPEKADFVAYMLSVR